DPPPHPVKIASAIRPASAIAGLKRGNRLNVNSRSEVHTTSHVPGGSAGFPESGILSAAGLDVVFTVSVTCVPNTLTEAGLKLQDVPVGRPLPQAKVTVPATGCPSEINPKVAGVPALTVPLLKAGISARAGSMKTKNVLLLFAGTLSPPPLTVALPLIVPLTFEATLSPTVMLE